METKQLKVMAFCRDEHTLATAGSILDGMDRYCLQRHKADFVKAITLLGKCAEAEVLLIEVQPDDLLQLSRLARVTPPGCRVILWGPEIDVSGYRQLIQLGVSDYLSLPLEPSALRRTLRHVSGEEGSTSLHHAMVHLVTGTSGGVGVSTLAANLACGLAQTRSTALVDFNTSHSQHPILLGLDYQPCLHRLTEDIERVDALLIEQFAQQSGQQLSLFYSEQQEALSAGDMLAVITKLRQQFAHLVLDLPSHLTDQLQPLFSQTDNCLLVHDFSLQAGRRMDQILATTDRQRHTVQIIGNQSRSGKYKPWRQEQLLEAWDSVQFSELPFDGKAVQRSEHTGKPLVSQRGRLSSAIGKLKIRLSGGV